MINFWKRDKQTRSHIPHLFSRFDVETKNNYKRIYKRIKKYGYIRGGGIPNGKKLAKDILNSKLKAYGSKSIFKNTFGRVLKFAVSPLKVLGYASKMQKLVFTFQDINDIILEAEMVVSPAGWFWLSADILVFGEVVSVSDKADCFSLPNKTLDVILNVINDNADKIE